MFGVTSTVTAEIRLDLPKKGIQLILLQNLGIAEFDKSFSSSKNAYLHTYTIFSKTFQDIYRSTKVFLGFQILKFWREQG